MPNLDKTGPNGKGPMTGREKGNCIDEKTCVNGQRKRCCAIVNKDFCDNRMNRNKRG